MIYVHIPFCRSFCTYCDFYSEIASDCSGQKGFAQALSAEISARSAEIRQNIRTQPGVHTLYIGGGTPSVLPLTVFRRMLDDLSAAGAEGPFDEFTVEVNPEDIVEKGHAYAEGLLELGVNRVSMGVQSFDDDILKWMNRRHDSERARKAYMILEEAGFDNISIDLIFGLPQLSSQNWIANIEKALEISPSGRLPKHISSYQLSVEEGSALARMLASGKWIEASDEVCAGQYEILCSLLAEAGYGHYEISNFSLKGYEAVHNSAYWRHLPYVGLGPGAHSFSFPDVRKWNDPNLKAYLEAAKTGDFGKVSGGETLTAEQLRIERIMLALRTSEGLSEEDVREVGLGPSVSNLVAQGKLQETDGGIRIPEAGFFISDSIISELV